MRGDAGEFPVDFGVRRQSEAATALWIAESTLRTRSKAPSPLRSSVLMRGDAGEFPLQSLARVSAHAFGFDYYIESS